jgi:hypothetical protein
LIAGESVLVSARQFLAALAVLFCQPPLAIAAEPESAPTEEIVVTGQQSLLSLRNELLQAEEAFFDRYNLLNDDDRYDIICTSDRPTGSRIPVRQCKARIIRDAEMQATQDQLLLGTPGASIPGRVTSKHYRILEEKLKAFATSDAQLKEALMNYDRLDTKYNEERDKRIDELSSDKSSATGRDDQQNH